MHYTLDYDSASTTKANIDKWRVSLRVIYQDHERAASVGRRSSTNNVCNNVASRFFNFTFTGIPLANPPFFPFFLLSPPSPTRRSPLVSISDSNLMASWYLSHDLPIPISRYRPALDDDGFRLARHHSRHLPKVPRRGDSQNAITVWRNSRSKWFQVHQIFENLVIIVPCVRVSRDCEEIVKIVGIFNSTTNVTF